jgi:hypothetical protein
VSPEISKEYIKISRNMPPRRPIEDVVRDGALLFSKSIPDVAKKLLLCELAIVDTEEAFRMIVQFAEDSVGDVKQFAYIVRKIAEARMIDKNMSHVFGGRTTDTSIVVTGLGGDSSRFRYVFMVATMPTCSIGDSEMHIINKVALKPHRRTFVEDIQFGGRYVILTSLVSMDTAPDAHIMKFIADCNKDHLFLQEHYFAKNTAPFTKKEVVVYLKEQGIS